MIALKSASHGYAHTPELKFRDWQINEGEQWLLSGASGSGKTTLLHILTGILAPQNGEVIINETLIYQLSAKSLDRFRGRNIGIVFQHPHLIRGLTIAENLILAQSLAQLPENPGRINEVLESLDIAQKKNAFPAELSQGQLQRVSIARALINKPLLLIADEPTSSLDDKNATAVLELLLKQSGLHQVTLVVATHDKRVKDSFTNTYQLK